MKKIFLLVVLVFVVANIFAQTANFSLPYKNTKDYDYAVLGKTTEGILVYKFNKYESIVECYDVAMNIKWTKNAEMDSKFNTIEHISVHNNKIYIFFSYKRNGNIILSAQKFSAKLESEGKNVGVDSFAYDRNTSEFDWFVKHSEDKRYYMVYYIKQGGETQTTFQTILVDDKLKIQNKRAVVLKEPQQNLYEELIDNEGGFYFLTASQIKLKESGRTIYAVPNFYCLPKNNPISSAHLLTQQNIKYNSIYVKLDNIQHTLIAAGVAKEKIGDKDKPGFQISKYCLDKDSLALDQLTPFNSEMSKEMLLTQESNLDNFELSDIVVRFDGGLILVAENSYVTTQTVEVPNYYSPAFPTIRTYTYFHKDDIALQSFDKTGEAEWFQIIHKKQTSESEGNVYNSYGLMKGKNSIRLFYNESIEEQSNLAVYTIKAGGTTSRNSVYGSHQKNLFLMPKKASQVSLYEVIIPSENRGYAELMKIDF